MNAMCGNIFKPSIRTVAPRCLYGNWMTMGVETLDRDYDLVWAVQAARIRPITNLVRGRFGLGTEVRLGRPFPYWTAIELSPGAPVPAGMVQVIIPSGTYLALEGSLSDRLASAYDFAYNYWESSQSEYVIDRLSLCFEQYGPVGGNRDEATLFLPLISRATCSEPDDEARATTAEAGPGGSGPGR